mgnify:CR=1 FL=1
MTAEADPEVEEAKSPGIKKKQIGTLTIPNEELPELPNFLSALFDVSSISEQFVVTKTQYREIEQIMESFYSITSDKVLDENNDY